MPDVVDFLVLKQNYDIAMERKWATGTLVYLVDICCYNGTIHNVT